MKKYKTLSILAVVFFSLLITIKGETENSIILTTPSKWLCNPSQPQTLLLDFLDPEKLKVDSLNLNITLVSRNSNLKQTVLQKVDSLNKNALKLITFNIPEFFKTGQYDLELTATNEQSAYEFKRKLTNIECSVNGLGLYIMTDKAVYRASDLVRIRVVYIDSSLNPYDGKLATVNILDPNGFQVQRFVDRKFRSGLIDGLDFQLSDRPIYGKWTIQLIVDGIIKESELTVKEYVLPSFVISLKGPKYVLKSAKSFDGKVEVKYSNGNSFDGMVNIRLIRDYKAPNKDGDKLEKKQDVLFEDDFKIVKSKSKFTVALKPRIEYDGIKVIATVTDSVSKESASREIPIVFFKLEFYVIENTKGFFPDESNRFEISLMEINQNLYVNREMILTINEYTNWTSIDKAPLLVTEKKLTTDSNGKLDYFMDIEEETRVLSIQLSPVSDLTQKVFIFITEKKEEDPNESDIRFWIFPSFSETNTEPELTPNSIANITLHKSKQFECVDTRYLVIGKSQILNHGTINLCDEATVRIQLTPIYAPYSTFIAYFISSKGQLVTTSYEIEIPNFYRNQLTINMGKKKPIKPGETVEIRVKSQPQSLIALRVVDRTALEMMGKTGEIDTTGITSQIRALYQPDYNQTIPSPSQMNAYLNSPAIFERTSVMTTLNKLGLAVASDIGNLQLFIENNDDSVTKPSSQIGDDSTQTRSGSLLNGQKSDSRNDEDNDLLVENDGFVRKVDSRSDFKEVWIWDTISLEDNKEKTIESKLPETMTSWIASGFSLHPELGIAIATPKQITASKDFFISTILPSNVNRGETIRLQVVLFNNMDADLINIQVGLETSSDFEMSSNSEQLVERVEKQSTQTVEFVVTPLKLGRLKLVISASSSSVSDGEVRFLNVNNGVNSEQSVVSTQRTQAFLAAFTLGVARIVKDVDVQFPSDVVSGSQVCSIQAVGDILGPTYNRTQSIIQFKRNEGGDTNMIRFTWNLYALHYMSSAKNVKNMVPNIDLLVSSAKQNILYMYERQLRFSRKDGSFNIDNDSNGSGSTWLTAFILNSFVQAQKYLPDDIDGSVINKAAEFLRTQQDDEGWFEEKSPINDRSIRGGLSGRTPLTAYVISALIESKLATKGNVRKALAYLEAEAPKVKQLYTLGLVVNALDLAKSSLADEYFALFESRSNKTDDGLIYWRATDKEELSSINTELTGYGLLMSLRRKNVVEVLPIVRYLVSKMNPKGGFYDTQDTVFGLGSLAAYNSKLQSATTARNLKVDVTLDNDLSSKQTLVVNDQNEFVLQTVDLAMCPKTVKFLARGSGSAIFQFVSRYNLSK